MRFSTTRALTRTFPLRSTPTAPKTRPPTPCGRRTGAGSTPTLASTFPGSTRHSYPMRTTTLPTRLLPCSSLLTLGPASMPSSRLKRGWSTPHRHAPPFGLLHRRRHCLFPSRLGGLGRPRLTQRAHASRVPPRLLISACTLLLRSLRRSPPREGPHLTPGSLRSVRASAVRSPQGGRNGGRDFLFDPEESSAHAIGQRPSHTSPLVCPVRTTDNRPTVRAVV